MIANICFEFGTFGARFIWLAFAACTFPSGDHDGVMAFASYYRGASPRVARRTRWRGSTHNLCYPASYSHRGPQGPGNQNLGHDEFYFLSASWGSWLSNFLRSPCCGASLRDGAVLQRAFAVLRGALGRLTTFATSSSNPRSLI